MKSRSIKSVLSILIIVNDVTDFQRAAWIFIVLKSNIFWFRHLQEFVAIQFGDIKYFLYSCRYSVYHRLCHGRNWETGAKVSCCPKVGTYNWTLLLSLSSLTYEYGEQGLFLGVQELDPKSLNFDSLSLHHFFCSPGWMYLLKKARQLIFPVSSGQNSILPSS